MKICSCCGQFKAVRAFLIRVRGRWIEVSRCAVCRRRVKRENEMKIAA